MVQEKLPLCLSRHFSDRIQSSTMESWEALDIDDSDLLPSLAPPQHVPTSLSKTLLPCSKRPRPCTQPQTLESQSQQPQLKIPGPAGTIQSAMHRRALRDQTSKEDFPSTQEYLKRAIQEDENTEDDDDFKMNPWICGSDFVNRQRSSLGASFSLGSIKKCRNRFDRVPLVVVIVKSCTPNGLGDLIVTLKDPSGTVGGNIHHKVVSETEFGKDISVGSVLVLHKVAVFSPSPSACYLNITVNNVIKVIQKDSGPPPSNMYLASPVRAPASVTGMNKDPASVRLGTAERIRNEDVGRYTDGMLVNGGTQSSQRTPLMRSGTAERIRNEDVGRYTNGMLVDGRTQSSQLNPLGGSFQRVMDTRSSQHTEMLVDGGTQSSQRNPLLRLGTTERITNVGVGRYGTQSSQRNPVAGSFQHAMDTRSSQHTVLDVEPLVSQEVALDATASKEATRGMEEVVVNRESQGEGILPGTQNFSNNVPQHSTSAKPVDNSFNDIELGRNSRIRQKPQWTDEQLEELLAGCDDW